MVSTAEFRSPKGLPGALQIGEHLSVFPPVLQAPMSGLTNLAMRTLSEEQGCGMTVTEWLPAAALAARSRNALNKLRPSETGRPLPCRSMGETPSKFSARQRWPPTRGQRWSTSTWVCPGKKVSSGSVGPR